MAFKWVQLCSLPQVRLGLSTSEGGLALPGKKTGRSSGCAIKKSRLNTKIHGEFCIIFFAGRPEKMKKMQNLQTGGGYWSMLDASSTNTLTESNEPRAYPRDVVAGVATARPRTAPCR